MQETNRRLALWLFALIGAAQIYGSMLRQMPAMSENDRSRWNTVWALAEGRGYVIDDAPYETLDKVMIDGRFYSSKPPFLPTILGAGAWAIKATTGMTIANRDDFVNRLLLVLVNLLPMALMWFYYAKLLDRMGIGESASLYCLAAFVFGIYPTAYAITLTNHVVGAWSAFFAAYHLWRILYDGENQPWRFAACALFASILVLNELPALAFAALVFAWLLARRPGPALRWFLPVAAAMGGCFFYLNFASTGRALPPQVYSIVGLEPGLATKMWTYEGSYWTRPGGVDALREPKGTYLYNFLVGHHGIFSLTPIFALSLAGFLQKTKWPAITAIGAVSTISTLAFYVKSTSNYGGYCPGPRWLFWLMPIWMIPLAAAAERHFSSRLFRVAAYIALFVSAASVAYAMRNPWRLSWLHEWMAAAGWTEN